MAKDITVDANQSKTTLKNEWFGMPDSRLTIEMEM